MTIAEIEHAAAKLAGELLKQWNEQDAQLFGGDHFQRVEQAAALYLKTARMVYGLTENSKEQKEED